jgi:hypothetical protein
MLGADFDTVYEQPILMGPVPYQYKPPCNAPMCFIGSYPPITHAGYIGPFFVNTYYLEGDRKRELAGPVIIRSDMFVGKCNN